MPFIQIDGRTLHYTRLPAATQPSGTDPHLVFINSLGTDFRIWDEVATTLGGSVPMLLYDKRGHGLSDAPASPYSIEDHVGDLVGLVDRLGVAEVVLCGLSVGGQIALGFYKRRPAMVKGLVLCDTAHQIGTQADWNGRIAAAESGGVAALADGIMKRWFTPAFHERRKAELAGYRNMVSQQPVAGYAGTCHALRDADYGEVARSIRVPTLCVVGDQDGSTPPAMVRAMADLIPGAGFEVIEGCGHIPCVEQPAALNTHLKAFLSRLAAGKPTE